MFLVVLIKPNQIQPLNLVESDAIAATVANTIKNRKYDAMVFQGSGKNLANLMNAIRANTRLNRMEEDEAKTAMKTMAEKYGAIVREDQEKVKANQIIQNLEFDGFNRLEASKVLSYVMEEQKQIKIGNYAFGYNGNFFYDNMIAGDVVEHAEPKAFKRPPAKMGWNYININPTNDAKKMWQYVYKNHNKTYQEKALEKYPDDALSQNKYRWIALMIIYQRVAIAKRVKPWKTSKDSPDMGDTSQIRQKIEKDSDQAEYYIDRMFDRLKDEALVKKLGIERFSNVERRGDKYYASTKYDLTLGKNVAPEDVIRYLTMKMSLKKARDAAVIRISPLTELIYKSENNKLRVYVVHGLPLFHAQNLTENRTRGDDLIIWLKKLMNVWFQTGKLRFRKKDLAL